jgi:predicted  nucleic acid-binding Zn-ribbon protein
VSEEYKELKAEIEKIKKRMDKLEKELLSVKLSPRSFGRSSNALKLPIKDTTCKHTIIFFRQFLTLF